MTTTTGTQAWAAVGVTAIGLDNVRYPGTPQDGADGKHASAFRRRRSKYERVIGEEQMSGFANDLQHMPADAVRFVGTHTLLVLHPA